jgi:hypothetical protein
MPQEQRNRLIIADVNGQVNTSPCIKPAICLMQERRYYRIKFEAISNTFLCIFQHRNNSPTAVFGFTYPWILISCDTQKQYVVSAPTIPHLFDDGRIVVTSEHLKQLLRNQQCYYGGSFCDNV